jgi:hypothetical protein
MMRSLHNVFYGGARDVARFCDRVLAPLPSTLVAAVAAQGLVGRVELHTSAICLESGSLDGTPSGVGAICRYPVEVHPPLGIRATRRERLPQLARPN